MQQQNNSRDTEKLQKISKKISNKIAAVLRGQWNNVFSGNKEGDTFFVYENEDDSSMFGRLGHLILWMTVVFAIVMLLWAKFAILEEVTVAQGQVIPSTKTQLVQNLEGGIIDQVLVKEGAVVDKGAVVVRMSSVKFMSAYREGLAKEAAMRIKISRLDAEVVGKNFTVDSKMKQNFHALVVSEEALYNSRQHEIQVFNSMRVSLQKEVKMLEPLVKDGTISKIELLRLEQRLNEIDSNIGKFRSMALQELNEARAELLRLQENNKSLQDQLTRTEVRSPVRGVVKQIYVYTAGGVVNPGMPLMEVVPLDDTLLVEAKVRPQDIGFLHPGQNAIVKITAYDFSIYGGLKGKLEHISADTALDAKGNSFYEIWVRTDRNYLEKYGKKMQIIPGMQVSVDILTGYKSVMDYILKPILKAKQTALRER